MPKFGESEGFEDHNVGHFGFTATNMNDLLEKGGSEWTLATICCDRSGSTFGFQTPMELALKTAIGDLQKHPRSDSIMVRVLAFSQDCVEVHGFKPLSECVLTDYDDALEPQGATALFDAVIDGAEASAAYGKSLLDEGCSANAILIVITDGWNNAGRFCRPKDVTFVNDALKQPMRAEVLESFASVLIGVNMQQAGAELKAFHADVGFNCDMIDLKDAKPGTIGKIGNFISESVSSTSQALGTGGPSQVVVSGKISF